MISGLKSPYNFVFSCTSRNLMIHYSDMLQYSVFIYLQAFLWGKTSKVHQIIIIFLTIKDIKNYFKMYLDAQLLVAIIFTHTKLYLNFLCLFTVLIT